MIINGGAANGAVVEEESEVITVAGGEEVFEDMTLQTGSAVSFAAGNESTSTPISNPNILWGAAATAMLGATLAEWQRQRQEEEARRRAGNGGGDEEEEEASDVIAKRRLKRLKKINPGLAYAEEQAKAVKDAIAAVTASELKAWEYDRTKTIEATDGYKESDNKGQYLKEALQDIRNQEAAYREEQARIAALVAQTIEAEKTDEEKLTEYKQSESYLGRQEGYAEYYAQKEKEEQAEAYRQALIAKNEDPSPLDMAKVNALVQAKQEEERSGNFPINLWNAGASALGSILSPGNVGGGGLLSVRDDDPPPNPLAEWWDETFVPAWNRYVADPIKNLLGLDQPEPAPTSTPVAPLWSTPVEWGWTATPTLTQTITSTPTNTPTPTLISLTPSFYDYGIETIGFDDNGRQVVLNAANLTANKLLTVSPDLRSPYLAFAFIHGGKIQIILDPDYPVGDNDENCVVEVNKITCNTLPTEANLIHELGHIFWRNQVSKGVIMIDTVNPIRMSDGTYLDYDTEGNYWFRQPDGFLRGEDSWEHKPNGDTTSGDAKVEHSADMFLNFIYDGTGNKIYGFSLDQYGDARREEMLKILYQVFGK